MTRIALIVVTLTTTSVFTSGIALAEPQISCTATREFVTTLNYLRTTKELGLKENDARRIAGVVSTHCSGAAERFIRTSRMLLSSGMGGSGAIKTGLEMAAAEDRVAATFLTVFKHAFLEKYLDLSVSASLRLARSLSVEFNGEIQGVAHDFEQLVKFCTSENKLGMPKPECAKWAAELARKGQEFNGGIARPFLQAFNFLTSPVGPSLALGQAAKLAAELVAISPHSVKNFVQAYQFGVSKDGLRMDTAAALKFARKMASQTRQKSAPAKSKGEG